MDENKLEAIKKILDGESNEEAATEEVAEKPTEEPAKEVVAEEDGDKKVSVDITKVADQIGDKIAKAMAEAQGATSEADAKDMRKHLFQTSGDGKSDLDLRSMKLADFDIETVSDLSEKYADAKVDITPFKVGAEKREMAVTGAVRVLGFFKALLDGDNATVKALSSGVNAEGGFLVPREFQAEVVREQLAFGVMRRLARVFPLNTDTLEIPTLAARPVATWTAEHAPIATSSAEFGQITLAPNTLIVRLPSSRRLVADSAINIVSFITQLFAEEITRSEDKAFFTGSGSGQPRGINQETLKTVAGGGILDFDDLIGLFYKLQFRHRQSRSAAFVGSRRNIELLRKVKDTNGQYLWQASVQIGQPDRILGIPVFEQNDIAEDEVYFGDWAYYFIGDRQQLSVETTTVGGTAWDRHRLEMKATIRVDGRASILTPFAKITGASS